MRQLPLLSFLLAFTLGSLACGGGNSLPTTPEPAAISPSPPVPGSSPLPPEGVATGQSTQTVEPASIPGLMVAYIRGGNLWFWNESGPYQMTDSGGLTDVSISDDGLTLAFIRGTEIWTARTDGTEARPLITRTVAGGKMKFSPNGLLLAVSNKDFIQLIDLNTSTVTTVLTYPAILDGYEPEVVWSPDSSGFKTIVPAATEDDQAEFFYVFTTGTAASLAKFAMVSPDESTPFLSPDGGYVIYVAKTADDDMESLYLMDSSGATKPYGEPAEDVRAYGWQPDSKHFAYESEPPQQTLIGEVNGQPREITLGKYDVLRWVDENYFLALEGNNLYLISIDGNEMLVDSGVTQFDFSK